MPHFPGLAFCILVLALVGCESSEERTERLRLERLYALDNIKVAQTYLKADYGGAAYAKEYLEIQRECAKEELKVKGKWCEKYSQIQGIYRGLVSDSLRNGLRTPKF